MASRHLATTLAVALALFCAAAAPAAAQTMTGGDYRLEPWTIDGGGGASGAGGYDLSGTIGQPDAASSAAGDYALDGGFWWHARTPTSAVAPHAPLRFAFHPPAPNPSHGACTLSFDLPRESHVIAEVFAIDGRRVARVLDRVQGAGRVSLLWRGATDDGRALPSGVYLVRLRAGADQAVRRLVLLDH